MILFTLGVLLGIGCLAVYNEMYTRWLYHDVKRRAKEQGITQERLKLALLHETFKEIEENVDARTTRSR
jgi:hypothetical protein